MAIRGRIVDESLSPIDGGTVEALGSFNASSGVDGVFLLSGLPTIQGPIRLRVSTEVQGMMRTRLTAPIQPAPGEVVEIGDVVLRPPADSLFPNPMYLTGGQPVWCKSGDFNGDGRLDLAVLNSTNSFEGEYNLAVLIANADGSFQAPLTVELASGLTDIAFADLNGDGRLDIAASVAFEPELLVFLGNGDGTLQSPLSTALPSAASALDAADLNGDLATDLALALEPTSEVAILIGSGDGSFASPVLIAMQHPPAGVKIGDLNGDSAADLLTTSFSAADNEWFTFVPGVGDGSFSTHQAIATVGPEFPIAAPELSDLTGDGVLDIVTLQANFEPGAEATSVLSLVNDGAAAFAVHASPVTTTFAGEFVLGDVNADSKPDIFVVGAFPPPLELLLGAGDGTFVSERTDYGLESGGRPLLSDLDGNGFPDLALLLGGVLVVPGDGAGGFQVAAEVLAIGTGAAARAPVALAYGDVTGDGVADLVSANDQTAPDGGSISVLPGVGDGTFLPVSVTIDVFTPTSHPTLVGLRAIALADLDLDSDLDIVVRDGTITLDGSVWTVLSNGDGTFASPVRLDLDRGGEGSRDSLLVRDLNSDTFPDIVASALDDRIALLFNDAAGGFGPAQFLAVGRQPSSVDAADINGDSFVDIAALSTIVTLEPEQRDMAVLLGLGSGSSPWEKQPGSAAGSSASSQREASSNPRHQGRRKARPWCCPPTARAPLAWFNLRLPVWFSLRTPCESSTSTRTELPISSPAQASWVSRPLPGLWSCAG